MISSSMRWTIFILLSLFFPSTHLHPADPLFSTHLTFDVDFRPVLGITASFDGHVEDIVVVDRSDTLFSLINHGEFDFTEVKVGYLGRDVSDLLLADFNRDGLDDLLSANASDNSVTHLSGEGGGFFAESGTITVGENPVAIASGNFDLDDQLDFAVLNKADETVIILLGDSEGNFTHGDTLQTGLEPEDIASGDFNRDGYLDIATCNYLSDDITVFLGDSTGHLYVLGSYPASNGPNGIDIGDIDEDGLPDLVVSNINSRAIALLIGNGDGSFRREEVTPLVFCQANKVG